DFELPGAATAMVTEATGSVVMVGDFQKVDQSYRAGVLRLNLDGTIDPGFVPPLFDAMSGGTLESLVGVASDDVNRYAYVGGSFPRVGGTPQTLIARLSSATGALDASWAPTILDGTGGGWVQAIGVDQGSVYIGGEFLTVNGIARSHFAKLLNTGA